MDHIEIAQHRVAELSQKGGTILLFYSGGKDSYACLELFRPHKSAVKVVFVDTGCHFPEVYEHIEAVKKDFDVLVLHSNAREFVKNNGWPVDIVPTRMTRMGYFIYGEDGRGYSNRFDCCKENLWGPMTACVYAIKPQFVVRGDRGAERRRGPSEENGIRYEFPIFDWTDEQVVDFVKDKPLFHERMLLKGGSSLDCMVCRAYMDERGKGFEDYLERHYPDMAKAQREFFTKYRADILRELGDK